jgi:hypothetical protein
VANQIAMLVGVASGWAGIEFMKSKFMWSRPPRITARPEPGTELVVNARRKGRPPLGSQPMSGAERTLDQAVTKLCPSVFLSGIPCSSAIAVLKL